MIVINIPEFVPRACEVQGQTEWTAARIREASGRGRSTPCSRPGPCRRRHHDADCMPNCRPRRRLSATAMLGIAGILLSLAMLMLLAWYGDMYVTEHAYTPTDIAT